MTTVVPPTPTQPPTNPQPTDSGTSPTSAAGAGTPPANAEYRYPADYKIEYLRGKTADEGAQITAQLADALRGYVQNGTPAPAPQAFEPEPAQAPPSNQYVTRDEANGYAASLANLALDTVRQRNAQVFQKYGPEVDILLSRVPVQLRTVDNLQQVCDIVRGRHVNELAREEAARLVSTMEPALRSTGAAAVPVTPPEQKFTLQSEVLTEEQKLRFARAGVTERTIDEWCASTGQSRQQFFEPFFRGQVITEAPRR